MEKLTLTLYKTKDTKNKVVYGTRTAMSSRASTSTRMLWRRSTGRAPGGHITAVSPGSLLRRGNALGASRR